MKYHNPLTRLYCATVYSLSGLAFAVKEEQAFKYEAIVLVILCATLFWLRLPLHQSMIMVGAWLAVMALELVNSAVEKAFNLIDKEYNIEVKAGKDMLSAAVFLIIMLNIALWIIFALRYREGQP